jgi:hypothetical protein
MEEPVPSRVVALLAVLAIALAVGAYRLRHDKAVWSPDGAIYLRMSLQDRGVPAGEALRQSNRFALDETSLGRDPKTRAFYGDDPPEYYRTQAGLFVTRPLYPALGALLLPRFGPFGLKVISAVAFVAAAALMYLLLLEFAAPWLAALGALALALTPNVQDLAAAPLTDMTALAFWIGALGALFAFLRAPSPARLGLLIAATALLAVTRPAIFLPFGAALGAFAVAPRGSAARAAAGRAALAVFGVGAVYGAYTVVAHGPGIGTQLHWLYEWQRGLGEGFAARGFAGWWVLSVGAALAEELTVGIYKHNLLLTVLLAAFGLMLAWRTTTAGVVIGALIAGLATLLVTPLDVDRAVSVPLTPPLLVLATVALAALAGRAAERRRTMVAA